MARTVRPSLCGALLAGALLAAPASGQAPPLPVPVEQTALTGDAFSTGALSRNDGALGPDLWRGADPATLADLLDAAPSRLAGPSLGEAMRRVLLSSGVAPEGAGADLGGRKLLALARAGFFEEARTIASLSSAPRGDPFVSEALAVADLYEGATDEACRRNANLTSGRDELFWVKLRVLCYALAGERDAADLTFDLLRDRGLLSQTDATLLAALVTGIELQAPVPPRNALHLAALRALELPLEPGLLGEAEGGVLNALARDSAVPAAVRIEAGARAAAMGALSSAGLATLYGGVPLDVAAVASAAEIAAARPADPMTDVLLYQSIAQMTAPEFLRDKAARIAEALGAAGTFPRAYAAALLYADDIRALEGALVTPAEAGRFALARMAVGDADGAARWLFAMIGTGGASALAEEEAMDFIAYAELLAKLDPVAAELAAERAGVALGRGEPPGGPAQSADQRRFARIVEAAFDAAVQEIPGQAGLAALAASGASAPGDPVAEIVIGRSLKAAGLDDLRRRMSFEAAWKARFAAAATPAPADPIDTTAAAVPAPAAAGAPVPDEGRGGLTPRLKPRSRP